MAAPFTSTGSVPAIHELHNATAFNSSAEMVNPQLTQLIKHIPSGITSRVSEGITNLFKNFTDNDKRISELAWKYCSYLMIGHIPPNFEIPYRSSGEKEFTKRYWEDFYKKCGMCIEQPEVSEKPYLPVGEGGFSTGC